MDLPVVTFGKYKDKYVTELLADQAYIDWLKLQPWFQNHKQIYNIVVNQTISTSNNSKTPEHNKLQNLFLDENNQLLLYKYLFKNEINIIENILNDKEINRCFGINILNSIFDEIKNSINPIFEDKFNWDIVLYIKNGCYIVSNIDIETEDKIKYKEQYDKEQETIYDNKIKEFDEQLTIAKKYELDRLSIKNSGSTLTNFFKLNQKLTEKEIITNKEIYEKDFKNNYNKKFEKHYVDYRKLYYSDIVKKYTTSYHSVNYYENTYSIRILDWIGNIYCEIKPTLGDDYPNVLRKMKTQIELTITDRMKTNSGGKHIYLLIVGTFNSVSTTNEQLISIFKQSNINIIFINNLFQTHYSSINKITNDNQSTINNELTEQNKLLSEQLLNAQQQIMQLKETINHLENEINLLKS